MKKIAFVTYSLRPELSDDDQSALPFLDGCEINVLPWDAPDVEWEKFDAVVLRSCWDYHLRLAEFLKWLDYLEENNVKLFNPSAVVRQNSHKSYLKNFAAGGVATIPTIWLEQNSKVTLYEVLQSENWEKAVIKPAVSAAAFQTWTTSPEAANDEDRILKRMLVNSAVLLQPFVSEVVTKGEWSFIFFNRKYSHPVLKCPKTGDFRVQEHFGGYLDETAPPKSLIEQAQKVLNFVEDDLLYARVDGVEIQGRFYLMELELIEPVLFLSRCAEAPQKFAESILSKLGRQDGELDF